jgi:hypothetical protein
LGDRNVLRKGISEATGTSTQLEFGSNYTPTTDKDVQLFACLSLIAKHLRACLGSDLERTKTVSTVVACSEMDARALKALKDANPRESLFAETAGCGGRKMSLKDGLSILLWHSNGSLESGKETFRQTLFKALSSAYKIDMTSVEPDIGEPDIGNPDTPIDVDSTLDDDMCRVAVLFITNNHSVAVLCEPNDPSKPQKAEYRYHALDPTKTTKVVCSTSDQLCNELFLYKNDTCQESDTPSGGSDRFERNRYSLQVFRQNGQGTTFPERLGDFDYAEGTVSYFADLNV